MFDVLARMMRTGILTELIAADTEAPPAIGRLQNDLRNILGRALCIRHVDAGSCNGCELEIHVLNNAFYDLERF
ncbi:MAG: formate hydrogenlyase, partial [Acidobacteriota bacterium]|nr:formate hydrogenlyase [Acidobacteriota bacterium]